MDSTLILIDGYNVIRRNNAFAAAEQISLETARVSLLSRVVARYRGTPHRVIVVFDGGGRGESTLPLRCGVGSKQIFSASDTTADEVIGRLVEQARDTWGERIRVISDDWEVARHASCLGASTGSVSALAGELSQGARHLRHRAQHHAYVRERERDDAADQRRGPRRGASRKPPRQPRAR